MPGSRFFETFEPRRLLSGGVPDVGQPPGLSMVAHSTVPATPLARPSVAVTRPGVATTAVDLLAFVSADVLLPNPGHGVDSATLSSTTVYLELTVTGERVPAAVNTSAAGDSIVLTPASPLSPLTRYRFVVTEAVKDTAGAPFLPYASEFTTGLATPPDGGLGAVPGLAFDKAPQTRTVGHQYTAISFGPDGNLYAGTRLGHLIRFTVDADGAITGSKTFRTVRDRFAGDRIITGIAFSPHASRKKPPVVYFTHGDGRLINAPDWSSRISRLSGKHLTTYADLVIGLPRSYRDHLTNQLVFSRDNKAYVAQGSNSAMGAPDPTWNTRPERLLTGAILEIDVSRIADGQPIDVRTEGVRKPYNPFAPDAIVKIFATGIRNAYDLVWTRDGKLFAPNNGSAAGGNTPSVTAPFSKVPPRIDAVTRGKYLGPAVPALSAVSTQDDQLFHVERGRYYGHPNPLRGEYVAGAGNPTAGVDSHEVAEYPVGTRPDRNHRPPAYTFGKNYSPNGIIEYTGTAFGNALNGALMVVRYSGGDDVLILRRDAKGNVTGAVTGIAGLRGFVDPVDLVQHPSNGAVYVAEYAGRQITLLRPRETPATPPPAPASPGSPAPRPPIGPFSTTPVSPVGLIDLI